MYCTGVWIVLIPRFWLQQPIEVHLFNSMSRTNSLTLEPLKKNQLKKCPTCSSRLRISRRSCDKMYPSALLPRLDDVIWTRRHPRNDGGLIGRPSQKATQWYRWHYYQSYIRVATHMWTKPLNNNNPFAPAAHFLSSSLSINLIIAKTLPPHPNKQNNTNTSRVCYDELPVPACFISPTHIIVGSAIFSKVWQQLNRGKNK